MRSYCKSESSQGHWSQIDDNTPLLSNYLIDSEGFCIVLIQYKDTEIFKRTHGTLRIFLSMDIDLRTVKVTTERRQSGQV